MLDGYWMENSWIVNKNLTVLQWKMARLKVIHLLKLVENHRKLLDYQRVSERNSLEKKAMAHLNPSIE